MDAPIQPGETWHVTVPGRPVPQGDLSAMPLMRHGKPVLGQNGRPIINVTHQNDARLKPWRAVVASAVTDAGWPALGLAALDEPLAVRMVFYYDRPDAQYGTGRNESRLKDSAELYPTRSGADVDKLQRAVLDALTGVIWKDDKRIVSCVARRRYGVPRLELYVRRMRVRTMGDLRELRGAEPDLADVLAGQLQISELAFA